MLKKIITVSLLLTLFSLNLLSVNAQGANSEGISMEKAKEIALKRVKGRNHQRPPRRRMTGWSTMK